MKKRALLPLAFNMIYQSMTLYLLLAFFHSGNNWMSFLLFEIVCLLSIMFFCSLSRKKSQISGTILTITFAGSYLISYFLWVPSFWTCLIYSGLFTWGIQEAWKDPRVNEMEKTFVFSIFFLIAAVFIFSYQEASFLFLILILQLFGLLFLKWGTRFDSTVKKPNKELALLFVIPLSALVLASLLSWWKSACLLLIDGFAWLFYYVILLPVSKLLGLLPVPSFSKAGAILSKIGAMKKAHLLNVNLHQEYKPPFIPVWIYWIIGILLFIAAALYLRKRNFTKGKHELIADLNHHIQPSFDSLRKKRTRWLHSENEVRKMMLKLEKQMVKKGLGRESSESVKSWFHRLSIKEDIADPVRLSYEKVRYSSTDLNMDEMKNVKQAFKQLQSFIQTLKKDENA